MRLIYFTLSLIVFSLFACQNDDLYNSLDIKGNLVIIGGGNRGQEIMDKIMELAGGKDARIVIIPNAWHDRQEAVDDYVVEFTERGAGSTVGMILEKGNVDIQENFDKLNNATAVYFCGGDQSRLTDVLVGTELLKRLKERYHEGILVAGTSAGAAVMSKIMITGEELINDDEDRPYNIIRKGNIHNVEGFGLVESAIIDQHYIIRKRMNRLHSLILENKDMYGIGIDEGTAIWVHNGNKCTVLGKSGVMLYSAKDATVIEHADSTFSTRGFKIDLYQPGESFTI